MPNQHPNSAQSRAVGGTFFLRECFLWCNLLFCGRLIRWLDFRVFASAYFLFCKQERLARPFVKFFTIYFHLSGLTFWGIPHSTFTACVYAKYAHFIVCVSFVRPAIPSHGQRRSLAVPLSPASRFNSLLAYR